MKEINLIFPHQLFEQHDILERANVFYLVEEFLFFRQYKFHKQKIAFLRASMKYYQQQLGQKGIKVTYIESTHKLSDIRLFAEELQSQNINAINIIDPVDDWLLQRIRKATQNITLTIYDNPTFLNTKEDLTTFFKPNKKSFFQTAFYKQQRRKFNILLDETQQPIGGKWTYDIENRKKYPKGKIPPNIYFPKANIFWNEPIGYTEKYYLLQSIFC